MYSFSDARKGDVSGFSKFFLRTELIWIGIHTESQNLRLEVTVSGPVIKII